MRKKVHFYIPIIYCNDIPTRTPINNFINEIINIDVRDREVEIDDEYYSIIRFKNNIDKRDVNDNYMCLGRYRNKKPKQGEIGTDRLDNIDYDIVEPISIYHCNVNNIFMFDYNHFGPRKNKIERYFSSFLRDIEDENWEFKLVPIEKDFNLNELRQAEEIKYIEASFSRENNLHRLREINNNGDLGATIELIDALNNFLRHDGGNIADVKISNGRASRNHLDQDTMMLFIDLILQNNFNENFSKFNVKYKSANGKVKIVNLSDYGLYTSEINRAEGDDGWEYIVDIVENDYRNNHYDILNRKVNNYLNEQEYSDRIYIQ